MSKILIAYATTHGHTRKIAQVWSERLEARGHKCAVWNVADRAPDMTGLAGVVVMGSVHAGHHQPELAAAIHAHGSTWAKSPTWFVSVSLAAASTDAEEIAEIKKIASDFVADTGLRTDEILLVAGGIHDPEMNWITRWMLHQIIRAHGKKLDPSGHTEFTDWTTLDREIDRFSALIK
jgi:menaquinone-dependent protoporphyrinogen oxidase